MVKNFIFHFPSRFKHPTKVFYSMFPRSYSNLLIPSMGIVNRSDDENRSFSSSSSHLFSFISLSLSLFPSFFQFYRNFAHARSHSLFLSVSVCPSPSHCRISSISFPNLITRFNQFDFAIQEERSCTILLLVDESSIHFFSFPFSFFLSQWIYENFIDSWMDTYIYICRYLYELYEIIYEKKYIFYYRVIGQRDKMRPLRGTWWYFLILYYLQNIEKKFWSDLKSDLDRFG